MPSRLAVWRKDDVAKREARHDARDAAAVLQAAQEDQKRRREALDAARIARTGDVAPRRRPGLGQNDILTGLLGLLGMSPGGGARGLIGV